MNARDFLDVANDLVGGAHEADWRTAVSRGYYAAFHTARKLLQLCGFEVPRADQAHAYLWLRLSNCGHADIVQAGGRLKDLRGKRNWADYDIDSPFPEATAVDYVARADKIVQLLEEVPTVPTVMQQITTAIRAYEQTVLRQATWQNPTN